MQNGIFTKFWFFLNDDVSCQRAPRYAIHKLIVATRRVSSAAAKARKDIEQSAALIRVLAEDRPDELEDAFAKACERGPSWREAVDRGTRRMPPDAKKLLENAIGEHVRE